MRRLLITTLALGTALLGAPAATAHDNDRVLAACDATQEPDPFGGGEVSPFYLVYGVAVTPEAGGGELYCSVRVDGGEVAGTAAVHGEHVFYTANGAYWVHGSNDVVELCAHIDWDDGHPPYDRCEVWTPAQVPPQDVTDLVDEVFDVLNALLFEPADVVTCTVLRALAPGVPGIVDVDPVTGDTFVLGTMIWDCPPYETY